MTNPATQPLPWDLYATASPRTFAVFPVTNAATTTSTTGSSSRSGNASSAATSSHNNTHTLLPAPTNFTVALAFGTERGSVHYRCYNLSGSANGVTTTISTPVGMTSGSSNINSSTPGSTDVMRAAHAGLPRHLFPLDAPIGTLPGSVIACWSVAAPTVVGSSSNNSNASNTTVTGSSSTSPSLLFVLVDDSRGESALVPGSPGSSSTSSRSVPRYGQAQPPPAAASATSAGPPLPPGAFAAAWITLPRPGSSAGSALQVLAASPSATTSSSSSSAPSQSVAMNARWRLPRLSAAVVAYQRVYVTAGRAVWTIPIPIYLGNSNNNNSNHASRSGGGGSGRSGRGNNHHAASTLSWTFSTKQLGGPVRRPPKITFGPRTWPGTVRCTGNQALAVLAQGRVLVACVGHAFYAAPGKVWMPHDHELFLDDEDDDPDENDPSGTDAFWRSKYAMDQSPSVGTNDASPRTSTTTSADTIKLIHWTQSSQVHPVVALAVEDPALDAGWSTVFLANGRECAVVDLQYSPGPTGATSASATGGGGVGGGVVGGGGVSHVLYASKPRNGIVTTASPIVAAAATPGEHFSYRPHSEEDEDGSNDPVVTSPLLAILMSEGLISVRSPSCLGVSLRTVEVGTRPNDFFTLQTLPVPSSQYYFHSASTAASPSTQDPADSPHHHLHRRPPWLVTSMSYGGESKVVTLPLDTLQDLADRLVRYSLDAFAGSASYPKAAVAKAVGASSAFAATSAFAVSTSSTASSAAESSMGGGGSSSSSSSTTASRTLLLDYLTALLGLTDWESGAAPGWPTAVEETSAAATAAVQDSFGAGLTRGEGVAYLGKFSAATANSAWTGAPTTRASYHWNNHPQRTRTAKVPSKAVLSANHPSALLTSTALLCLAAIHVSPPAASLASRAAQACAAALGVNVVCPTHHGSTGGGSYGGGGNLSSAAGSGLADFQSGATSYINDSALEVAQYVADALLRQASQAFSLVRSPTSTSATPGMVVNNSSSAVRSSGGLYRPQQIAVDWMEATVWILRSCGKHERAMQVAMERLGAGSWTTEMSTVSPNAVGLGGGGPGGAGNMGSGLESSLGTPRGGHWSRIKLESYMATHLSELWTEGGPDLQDLVLKTNATQELLQHNPRLGLSVFTANHPQNSSQWRELAIKEQTEGGEDLDPLTSSPRVLPVLQLLKKIRPRVLYDPSTSAAGPISSSNTSLAAYKETTNLPLESGRALAIVFLESAIGVSTGRSETISAEAMMQQRQLQQHDAEEYQERRAENSALANFHDELALLLLEGVLAERNEKHDDKDTPLGAIYRAKLRRFLKWPLAQLRSDRFLNALPASFLPEKALILGRLGQHEESLRILYNDLGSLELALEYCDDRYEQQQQDSALLEKNRATNQGYFESENEANDNAYLPLVRVALESQDTEKACATAIQVLALRRSAIDQTAALRLLPPDIAVSAVARPFLIPALVDSASQARRLTVVSALLRARYLRLKDQLTAAQLKAQANLQVVPQLQSLQLGEPLHSTKPFRVRTSGTASSSNHRMPEVWIVKHFFPRHLVIQARVTNQATMSKTGGQQRKTLTDICFVVAESSEEAIQPLLQVPIAVLPSSMTGSTWCVLSAAPTRMEGSTAQLTCELRYTVGAAAVLPLHGASGAPAVGRVYVEELQDLEIHTSHFA